MKQMIRWSLNNGIGIVILTLLVLIGGYFSAQQIKLEIQPDVSFPSLFVQMSKPGYSAEDMEQKITNPLEDALKNISEIDKYTSTSSENSGSMIVSYPFGTDMEKAKSELDEKLNKVELPENAEVKIIEANLGSVPIHIEVFSAKEPEVLQTKLQDELVPALQKINGVGEVRLSGVNTNQWKIKVDGEKAKKYGLNLQAIKKQLEEQKFSFPLSAIEAKDQTISLRLSGDVKKMEEIKDLEVSASSGGALQSGQGQVIANGSPQPKEVKLSEIATFKEEITSDEITRFQGKDSFLLEVIKEENANTAEVGNQIKKEVAKIDGVEQFSRTMILDQAKEVEKSVDSLVKEGGFGALFTVVVIAIFLRNVRATLIAIVSLPLSIAATMIVLNQMDYTLNIMTLGGIAVAVGRIVDDSIVVIENIFRWKQQNKHPANGKTLAYHATTEVVKAVSSSTLVTVVVFLPLAFVSGIIGEFFRPFALAVVTSILVSLLVSFSLIPILGTKFFQNLKHREQESWLVKGYNAVLAWALKYRKTVLTLAILILIGSVVLVPRLGVSFLPAGEASILSLKVELPPGSTKEQTDALSQKIEKYAQNVKEVDNVQLSIGNGNTANPFADASKPTEANFRIKLQKDVNVDTVLKKLEDESTGILHEKYPKGNVTATEQAHGGPPTGNKIEVNLFSEDQVALQKASKTIERKLKANNLLKNVSNNLTEVRPKWDIKLNDEAKELNVSGSQVYGIVGEYLQPTEVNLSDVKLNDDQNEQKIVLSYEDEIKSQQELKEIEILTAKGPKELGDLVTIEKTTVPLQIQHQDGKKFAQVSATVKGKDFAKVNQQVSQEVKKIALPDNVELKIGGGQEDITEGFMSLGYAMIVAIGLVFLILSMTFRGLGTPILILTSLLFVPIGAILGLLVTGKTLSMSAMIGLLMLIGIVVTNAIVLLERIETNREQGMEQMEAIKEAAQVRLRPIIMTALATIFALVPLALSTESSQLISQGLAITVIGGLTTSTLLTLVVVPVLYATFRKKKITYLTVEDHRPNQTF